MVESRPVSCCLTERPSTTPTRKQPPWTSQRRPDRLARCPLPTSRVPRPGNRGSRSPRRGICGSTTPILVVGTTSMPGTCAETAALTAACRWAVPIEGTITDIEQRSTYMTVRATTHSSGIVKQVPQCACVFAPLTVLPLSTCVDLSTWAARRRLSQGPDPPRPQKPPYLRLPTRMAPRRPAPGPHPPRPQRPPSPCTHTSFLWWASSPSSLPPRSCTSSGGSDAAPPCPPCT